MIEKASELLERFIDIERKAIEDVDMPHMPTLGSAYEEITKQGIDSEFSIPKGLGLKVVSGFISIGERMLPQQIDGMLVHGNGDRYGKTEQFIYPIDQVLCIFEVKKTLNKSNLTDAFDHLRGLRQEYSNYFETKFDDPNFEPEIEVACKHFSQITGKIAPRTYSGMHLLLKPDAILFYSLVQETLAPLTIIHGYDGYLTEFGLREAFLDILADKGKSSGNGLGIPSLPTLVTSGEFSLIKGNGLPYIGVTRDRKWAALLSIRENVARSILEAVWSKIAVYFGVKMPWGEDLKTETTSPLMLAIPMEINDSAGWKYESVFIKESELRERNSSEEWYPYKVSKAASSLIKIMQFWGGELNLKAINEIANDNEISLDDLLKELMDTLLFKLDEGVVRPIEHELYLVEDKENNAFITSSRNRLDAWCQRHNIKRNYISLIILN